MKTKEPRICKTCGCRVPHYMGRLLSCSKLCRRAAQNKRTRDEQIDVEMKDLENIPYGAEIEDIEKQFMDVDPIQELRKRERAQDTIRQWEVDAK